MIISRYLTREVLGTLLSVTVVLLFAFLSQQTVRYLNFVAMGKVPTNVFLLLVSYEIPYLLALLLPLGLYLGILLAYGRLYADSEMSILHLHGFGNKKILKLTSLFALFMAVIVLFLMTWINPIVSAKRQQIMASDEATFHLVETLIPGRFQASADGAHVMYVEKFSRDHKRAENVFLAQEKKKVDDSQINSWLLMTAGEGYQEKDPASQDQLFVTTNGYRYEGTPGQNDYKITQFRKYSVRSPQTDARVTHQENESLSTLKLWQNYANPKCAAEFQWRISIAIATFFLALLAVPLSVVRPRFGRYIGLLPAIILYIVYINLLFIARHWVESGMIPVSLGMWWVHGIFLLFVFITSLVVL